MRVLLAAYGSTGDINPLLPVGQRLKERGHAVTYALPPILSLCARMAGMRSIVLRDQFEALALQDASLITTRFDGYASWRMYLDRYIGPTLAAATKTLLNFLRDERPDLVVTTPFALAASIAAAAEHIPRVALVPYPQLGSRGHGASQFGGASAKSLRALSKRLQVPGHGPVQLMHVPGSSAILHDEVVFHRDSQNCDDAIVGFPYFDQYRNEATSHPDDAELVITFGSFIGGLRLPVLERIAALTESMKLRTVVTNVPQRQREAFSRFRYSTAVGYVQHSDVFRKARAVIHHGGIGTTYAALRAGLPSVVMPQAFDQPFNARLVCNAGAALVLKGANDLNDIKRTIEQALTDEAIRTNVSNVASRLAQNEKVLDSLGSVFDQAVA